MSTAVEIITALASLVAALPPLLAEVRRFRRRGARPPVRPQGRIRRRP